MRPLSFGFFARLAAGFNQTGFEFKDIIVQVETGVDPVIRAIVSQHVKAKRLVQTALDDVKDVECLVDRLPRPQCLRDVSPRRHRAVEYEKQ
jgi:hypothetical protein